MAACISPPRSGQLAGNHFLTLTSGLENLYALGRKTLWEGAQKIVFETMPRLSQARRLSSFVLRGLAPCARCVIQERTCGLR